MRKGLFGFGIALIVFAVITIPIAFIIGTNELNKLDPEKNEETIRISNNGEIKTIPKGDYDIWFESNPGDVSIQGPNGEDVKVTEDSSLFKVSGKERYGTFTAEQSGIYTFNYDGGTLFIIKSDQIDTSFYDSVIVICLILGAVMIIAGIALVIVGVIMKPKFSILDYRREQMRRGGPPSSRRRDRSPPIKGGQIKSEK
jgi:hypothetical protein